MTGKLFWNASVSRREFLFSVLCFAKRPRIFSLNLKLQDENENRDRDNLAIIFKNEMVYWDIHYTAFCKFCPNARWIWSMSPSLCTTSAVSSTLLPLHPMPPKRTMAFQGVAGVQAEWKYLPLAQCECLNLIPKKCFFMKISDWVYLQQHCKHNLTKAHSGRALMTQDIHSGPTCTWVKRPEGPRI